jgi:hypothetical protein
VRSSSPSMSQARVDRKVRRTRDKIRLGVASDR